MVRLVNIFVAPHYNSETGRKISMRSTLYRISVPRTFSKRAMAENGRILHSVRYFSRFDGFSSHLLHKICFYIKITEASNSNSKSYSTCFTFPKNI